MPPSTPIKVLKTKLEVVAGVFVIMFVGTLIVIAVVDNVRRRRSGRRHSDTEHRTSATPAQHHGRGPTSRWPGRPPPTGTLRTPRHPRECDEHRSRRPPVPGRRFPRRPPGRRRALLMAGIRWRRGQPRNKRPRHSKPRFSSVTLLTSYLVTAAAHPVQPRLRPDGRGGHAREHRRAGHPALVRDVLDRRPDHALQRGPAGPDLDLHLRPGRAGQLRRGHDPEHHRAGEPEPRTAG